MPLPFLAGLFTKAMVGKALVGGAVAAGTTALANRSGRRQESRTHSRNRAEYLVDRDEQRGYDVKMRDESRAYNERISDKEYARLNDLKAMRKRVEDAGLNFSSYIKGGGGITGGGTPFESPSSGASIQAPVMSSANTKQSAGGAFVNTFFNSLQDNGLQEKRDRLEVEIMEEELKGLQRDGEALTKKNWGYSIPHAVTETKVEDDNAALAFGKLPTSNVNYSHRDVNSERDVPSIRAFGLDWIGSGNFTTGQTNEDAGGDPAGWALAPFVIGDTVAHTLGSKLGKKARDAIEARKMRAIRLDYYKKKYPQYNATSKRPKSRPRRPAPHRRSRTFNPLYSQY